MTSRGVHPHAERADVERADVEQVGAEQVGAERHRRLDEHARYALAAPAALRPGRQALC